jgi:hypothetical protein
MHHREMGSKAVSKQCQIAFGESAPNRQTEKHKHKTQKPRMKDDMIEARELPIGSKPGWELDQPELELDQENALPLKSTSER